MTRSQFHIWHAQVDQLVEEKQYEEALSLCENMEGQPENIKQDKLSKIRVLYSYQLFAQVNFYFVAVTRT